MDRRRFLSLLGLTAGSACVPVARSGDAAPAQRLLTAGDEVAAPRVGAQRIFWSVPATAPAAALTFDDGPDPEFTPRILDVLAAYDVRATFFAMGKAAERHPGLLREVAAAGHEVGSHGWSHLNLTEISASETRSEIEHGTKVVEEEAGVEVRIFRPPYGRFSEAAVKLLAPTPRDLVIWSVTRGELGWSDPRRVASHIVDETRAGDIVDLHDGIGRGFFDRNADFAHRLRRRREVEIDALPRIVEGLLERDLRLRTVSELLSRV